ncbi:MurR/RpiR family transcriptional regulator [Acuticoccus kandeliae]|uniref:MurR/RpiR family transcriptional regulator n=1 Tax=Acuticoccus kandeliae TaxID=2073160 RepID=UPI000D3EADE0|nr:MurR/RpiR family transcriptional regulator [Acuticoccus kandeliae]
MNDTRPLGQRLLEAYDEIPRAERKLADLLLESGGTLRHESATDLAQRAGVSKATAARLFQRLGYLGFKDAQKGAPKERPSAAPKAAEEGQRDQFSLSTHLDAEVRNLIKTIELQRSDELSRAIRMLAQGEKLWVVGFGDDYPLAHFARALVIKIRPDVRMIPIGGFSVPEEFASISSSDTMLAFGVGRRSRALSNVLRSAMQAGTHVILITDALSGRDKSSANVILRCRSLGPTLFPSNTAAVSLVTYLCAALAGRIGYAAIERLRQIEEIHTAWRDPSDPD